MLFVSLYIISIIIIKIFNMMRVSYDNIYNIVFQSDIFSMIIVVLINNLKKVNVRISFIKKGIKDKKSILIKKEGRKRSILIEKKTCQRYKYMIS